MAEGFYLSCVELRYICYKFICLSLALGLTMSIHDELVDELFPDVTHSLFQCSSSDIVIASLDFVNLHFFLESEEDFVLCLGLPEV